MKQTFEIKVANDRGGNTWTHGSPKSQPCLKEKNINKMYLHDPYHSLDFSDRKLYFSAFLIKRYKKRFL